MIILYLILVMVLVVIYLTTIDTIEIYKARKRYGNDEVALMLSHVFVYIVAFGDMAVIIHIIRDLI